MSSVQGIDQLLGELRSAAALAGGQASSAASESADVPEFSQVLKQSMDQVNRMQSQAQDKQLAFQSGDTGTDLQDVMVSLQKASLSFQTMVQVRNKLVTAYQEVMNMQV